MNLWIIRHAKSSWANVGQADFDRPLNDRGNKDGKRMIRWMRTQDERPQRIVASDAFRTRATSEFVRKGFEIPKEHVQFDHRVYEASLETLLRVVREFPGDCPSVALVGHNPGSTELINVLVGRQVIDNLPTFGVAMLDVPLPWTDVTAGCATLVALHTPKSLTD
jgi:phosphohistidine phosphatase